MQSSSAVSLIRNAASLLVYQAVLLDDVGQAWLKLLETIAQPEAISVSCLQAYGQWFRIMATQNQSWQDYLLTRILQDDNPFTQQVQRSSSQLSPTLIAAARHDLQILQTLYQCDAQQLSQWVQTVARLPAPPVPWNLISDPRSSTIAEFAAIAHWADALELFAAHYQKQGVGLFAQFRALRWQEGQFLGIDHADITILSDLTGYEMQKAAIVKNTEFLLQGSLALHVLLYGSRGSGKSSLVKALLNEYGDRGLRVVEVAKSELQDLLTIVEQLRQLPQKFIIFVDDLSFEEDEDTYKALKVLLEGSLTARSPNVVVYATSNRRHLIREFFGDRPPPRDSDEVHAWDTVQEKLSFSDRFGLTLTFEPANQSTYLQIVYHLATVAGLSLDPKDLEFRALQWATRHNGRSGRTARQFIDFLHAEAKSQEPKRY